jgi:hypothetical protein
VTAPALPEPQPLAERAAVDADTFAREVLPGYRPVVLRGQVAAWPAVAAGRAGPREAAAYLARFAGPQPTDVMIGPPEIAGRFFYNDDLTGFNFARQPVPLPALIARLVALLDAPDGYALYAGAAAADDHLPGWAAANPLDLPLPAGRARVWIGNETHISTHYDVSNNVACVVAGRRRFTLFPPDQIDNLYVGPLDTTIAGQPTSLVDLAAPDFDRYPRFAEAMRHALAADLDPGDAIFIPSLWWHNVRAAGPLNVLVNYWSEPARAQPFPALAHALMAIRDLPPAERAAWRGWFDHYVFADDAEARTGEHLPEGARGVLGSASPERTARMRQFLLRTLARG